MRAFICCVLLASVTVSFLGAGEDASIRVAVYNADKTHGDAKKKYSYGHEGLLTWLKQQPQVSGEEIASLEAAAITKYDVVILPCLEIRGFDATPAGKEALPDYYCTLPAYAEAGGGVVLLSKSTGFNYPWPVRSSPFPEVAEAYFQLSFVTWQKPEWPIQPAGGLELAKGMPKYPLPKTRDFGDGSVVLRQGAKGQTFLTACQGYPIGVAGTIGKGRVVFFGLPLGMHKEQGEDAKWYSKEGVASEPEQQILRQIVQWVAGARATRDQALASAVAAASAKNLREAQEQQDKLQKLVDAQKKEWSKPFDPAKSGPRPVARFMRGFSVQYHPQDPASQQRCVEILKRAHATQFLHHYGWEKDWPPPHAESLFAIAAVNGVRGMTMRTLSRMGYAANTAIPIPSEVSSKPSGPPDPVTFARYENYLSFFTDEPVQQPAHFLFGEGKDKGRVLKPEGDKAFREFVKTRVSADELDRLDFEGFYKECPGFAKPLPPGFLDRHQVLWSLAGQFCAGKLNGLLRGIRDWVKKADPNLPYGVTITPGWETWGPCGSFATIPEVPDMVWTDIYDTGGYRDRFLLEMLRSCGKKTALWNGWHLRSHIDYRRSCLAGVTHAEGVMTFSLSPYYPAQAGWSAGRAKWVPGGYEVARDVFGFAERNEQYLSPTRSAAKIAILCSERTMWNRYYASWGGKGAYIPSLVNAYAALLKCQLQADAIFAQHLEQPGKLAPYRVVLAFNAESLTEGQEQTLRNWVRSGGTLLATAETSRYDRFGRKRTSYGLGDVFHAKFVRQYADARRVPLEAFKKMQQRQLVFPKTFGPGTVMGDAAAYDYRGTAHTKVYDSDVIAVTDGGRAAANWNDGGEAAVWGQFGQGHCLFFAGKWLPYSQDFTKLMEPTMRWVLRETGLEAVVEIANASPSLEIHVRTQPDAKRLVIHVTNLGRAQSFDTNQVDPKTANYRLIEHPTENLVLRVKTPDGWPSKKAKVVAAEDGGALKCTIEKGRVVFEVPRFVMYSMVVVECLR